MSGETDRSRLESQLSTWGSRLRSWGVDGLVLSLLEAFEPLSPLGGQLLFMAQPALSVFGSGEAAGRWARLLEDPANVSWIREQLATQPDAQPDNHEEGSLDGRDD